MRKAVLVMVALAAVAGGAYGGWEWWTVGRFFESTDNAYVHSDISIVSPKIAGYVAEIRVAENQEVAAGDVLVVLDDAEYRAQAGQAEAAAEAAQAAIGSIDSRIVLEHSMIAQSDASTCQRASGSASRPAGLRTGQKPGQRRQCQQAALRHGGSRFAQGRSGGQQGRGGPSGGARSAWRAPGIP